MSDPADPGRRAPAAAGAWPGDALPASPDPGEDDAPGGDDALAGDDAPGGDDARPGDDDGATLALAHLHLRMGSLSLARAELEAAAGRGPLDGPSLVDLAEARWRTGDLAGAGEAANAAIAQAAEDPLAYVIAAEAVAALGRPAEARRLAETAVDRIDTSLDRLFAGIPRSQVWPEEPSPPATPGPQTEPSPIAPAPTAVAAAASLAAGRDALSAGDVPEAALRLSLAIRLDPGLAPGVLAAVGEPVAEPLLALTAGDALRLLGREADALEAYGRAAGDSESTTPETAEPAPPDASDAPDEPEAPGAHADGPREDGDRPG